MEYPQEKVLPYGGANTGSKARQVEQMFDHIAPAYDDLNHLMSLGLDKRWRRKAIAWLKPFQPKRIMDVATGTGDFALLACQQLKPDTLVGIDLSEGMMAVAKEKARRAGLTEHIRFVREDCTSLSLPDASFDAITVAFGIRNFEHLDTALTEMYRVLQPGGHLAILELSTPQRFPMRQLFHLYAKLFIPTVGRLFARDGKAYTYLPASIQACPQGEAMQEVIRKAGFANVEFRSLTFGTCTLYMATK